MALLVWPQEVHFLNLLAWTRSLRALRALLQYIDHQLWKRHVDHLKEFRGIPMVSQASSDSDNADEDIDLPVTGPAPVLDQGPVPVDPPAQVKVVPSP